MQEIENMDLIWFLELNEYESIEDQNLEEKKVYIDQVM